MTIASTLALALALLVLASTPGPGVMTVISSAMGRGFPVTAAMAAGIVLGDLVFVLFAVFGLSVLAQALGSLFLVVKLAGAAYLVWLGIKLIRVKPEVPVLGRAAATDRRGMLKSALAGFLVTLSNPKVILFYVGFLPSFLDLESLTPADLAVLSLTVVVVVGGVLLAYAGLAGQARRLLTSERRVGWMNRGSGAVMIGSGVTIATR